MRTMKANPGYLLILAMLTAPLAHGDGVADLVAKAESGDVAAQLELSGIYAKGEGVTKDAAAAVKWLTKAAEQGNAEAQLKLGGVYIGGRGVPKNSTEAAKWITLSANQGNAAAQCQLGRMHLTGAGVPKDDVDAYKWANLAATQGDPAAKKVLAFLIIRMTPGQIKDGTQRSQDFLDSKNAADKPLDLPGDPGAVPVEPLPLLVPE
jgi:TPR repeat protein